MRIYDAKTGGGEEPAPLVLEFLDETITVRELIRERVHQEVKDFNAKGAEVFPGLIQPSDAERERNGWRLRKPRMLDWKRQHEAATEAFDGERSV